jgi:hypothetical protein
VIEQDIARVASPNGLPSQEPQILIKARRKIRIDGGRELARTGTDAEPILAAGVSIDLNAKVHARLKKSNLNSGTLSSVGVDLPVGSAQAGNEHRPEEDQRTLAFHSSRRSPLLK